MRRRPARPHAAAPLPVRLLQIIIQRPTISRLRVDVVSRIGDTEWACAGVWMEPVAAASGSDNVPGSVVVLYSLFSRPLVEKNPSMQGAAVVTDCDCCCYIRAASKRIRQRHIRQMVVVGRDVGISLRLDKSLCTSSTSAPCSTSRI
ncbi:uncharacterized protein LOC129602455 [Paramacrobiotus metropolitanus]|uniref:uncharacterized protein LOC129602455 n=1 Tax=Paramacrobiotus metropolitanus TaxID=2943436 RepID=UPI0024459C23|nr:uncharacterized protein LOC129602455 [Paramacrobiotus metropolitanus]